MVTTHGDVDPPLNQRKHISLEWFTTGEKRLQVVWESCGTVSWFRAARPEDLERYRKRLSAEIIHEATVAFAEYMLTPRTLANALTGRTAFTKIEYEEYD
jgi:hypothetical protein